MVRLGIVLLLVGLPREAIARDWFRGFLDWDYPEQFGRDDDWLKVKLGRAAILVGAIALMVGGLREIA